MRQLDAMKLRLFGPQTQEKQQLEVRTEHDFMVVLLQKRRARSAIAKILP